MTAPMPSARGIELASASTRLPYTFAAGDDEKPKACLRRGGETDSDTCVRPSMRSNGLGQSMVRVTLGMTSVVRGEDCWRGPHLPDGHQGTLGTEASHDEGREVAQRGRKQTDLMEARAVDGARL